MATAETAMAKEQRVPWWLILLQGIFAIILGVLLLVYPIRSFVVLTFFIGVYWLVDGIFDIVGIFINHKGWAWKLFMGIIGIIAGAFLIDATLKGAVTLAYTTALIVGFMGLFYGVLGLVRGFQGAGWGAILLGALSIVLGVFILANIWATALAIPWVFGILAIVGGIAAIVMAFRLK
jgi:uncharacterized membrane protein HdeD (DUF308 family)